ncbi:MAG: ATP-dependent helicase [Syntrophobacteria bacterium]
MLTHLNEAQRTAVEHATEALLVLAGPGTGKTRTLIHRIAHLLEKGIAAPAQVMAVTFTRKAALEMATRLETLLAQPSRARQIHIGTFHAISGYLLRQKGDITTGWKLLTETDQMDLIKRILQDLGLSGHNWQPLETLRRISLAKGRLLSPEDLPPDEDSQFAHAYRLYQRTLKENNLLDFDDLIGTLLERWQEAPEVLARHQGLFRVLLVDEFQDVNEAQYRWLRLLASFHRNLCVVGDPDQSIYSFRGSQLKIFQRFQADFPEARVVKLEQTYRCSQRILEAAASVIACNANPLTCRIWSDKSPGPLVRLGRFADENREAVFVASEIERLLGGSSHYQIYRGRNSDASGEIHYGFADIAVLYRTHAQSRALGEILSRTGIPFQVVGEKAPFATRAADVLLSYLHFAMDPSDAEHLQVIFNLPPRGLGQKAQQWLDAEIARGIDPWEILRRGSSNQELPVRQQSAMDRLRRTVASLQSLIFSRSLPEVLESALEQTGIREHFQESGALESFKWLRLLAAVHGEKPAAETLPTFLEDLSHWRASDFFDPRADQVALMTLHAAKGLEFPVVFICGLDQGLLPFTHRRQGEEALAEERRLFYVAMTRARELLVLTTARNRFLFGEFRTLTPSPFLREIPSHCTEEVGIPGRNKKSPRREKQLTLF